MALRGARLIDYGGGEPCRYVELDRYSQYLMR